MSTVVKETELTIEHPLEKVHELTPGTTSVPVLHRETELVSDQTYDEKDDEIEDQFQEIYNSAMDAFDASMKSSKKVDPKYKARNGEVAVQFLNAALNAAAAKADLKKHKDKLNVSVKKASTPNTVNQNLVVTDRNELLKHLFRKDED